MCTTLEVFESTDVPVDPRDVPPPPPETSPPFSDGVADSRDNCPGAPNPEQVNSDDDPAGDACDNCKLVANGEQGDRDRNGIGDACQCGDVDGDGLTNVVDALRIARGELLASDPNLDRCDVDGDGLCNTVDALRIARGQVGSRPEDQVCPAYTGRREVGLSL